MLDRNKLLAEIAIMYYEENRTQSEIAKKMHLSRQTVSNMLHEAKEKEIVKIIIQHPNSDLYHQQSQIAKKYNLKSVLIAQSALDELETKKQIGLLCAKFVEEKIDNITKLGIGWGTTMHEYVHHSSFLNAQHLEITPLIGGVGIDNVQYHSNHLVFRLAEKYSASSNYFYAPAIAESIEVKDLFTSTELFKQVYNKASNVDMAIVGVGNPIESSTYRKFGYISALEELDIRDTNAIGDILGTFFGIDGKPVNSLFNRRMIGLTIDDLKKIPNTVVLASGREKIRSIQAILKNDIVNHLIIDDVIAQSLI